MAGLERRTMLPQLADRLVLAATALFALLALVLLVGTSLGSSPRVAAAALVYGMSLAGSSICSLVYNAGYKHREKSLWRFADHVCIFLLIAGTYTPLSLIGGGGSAQFLLPPVWAAAALGIALKIWAGLRYEGWFVLFYLAMGWLVLLGLPTVLASFGAVVLALIVAGGLAFSGGLVFFFLEQRWPWAMAGWHASVLVGCATHFVAIFAFVLPMG